MTKDEIDSWTGLAERLCVIIPVLTAGLGWLVKKMYTRVLEAMMAGVDAKLAALLKEVKPNGGNTKSLGDSVVRLEKITTEQNSALAELKTGQEFTHNEMAEAKATLKETTSRLDRFILHEGRHDLYKSALFQETVRIEALKRRKARIEAGMPIDEVDRLEREEIAQSEKSAAEEAEKLNRLMSGETNARKN